MVGRRAVSVTLALLVQPALSAGAHDECALPEDFQQRVKRGKTIPTNQLTLPEMNVGNIQAELDKLEALGCTTNDPKTGKNKQTTKNGESLGPGYGLQYRGCQTRAWNGHLCQAWTEQTPHPHKWMEKEDAVIKAGLGDHNFCRNPSVAAGGSAMESIWCYTTDPTKPFEECCPMACGNGKVEVLAGEQCDDGNKRNGDGCDNKCKMEPGYICLVEIGAEDGLSYCKRCRDGKVDAGEHCDDGNDVQFDGCDPYCYVEEGWFCRKYDCGQGGVDADDAACADEDKDGQSFCKPDVCGDGIVWNEDECDDGNTVDFDGCSSKCEIEPGFTCASPWTENLGDKYGTSRCFNCGNGIIDPAETCDDSNTVDGDGCSATCMLEDGAAYVDADGKGGGTKFKCTKAESKKVVVTLYVDETETNASTTTVTTTIDDSAFVAVNESGAGRRLGTVFSTTCTPVVSFAEKNQSNIVVVSIVILFSVVGSVVLGLVARKVYKERITLRSGEVLTIGADGRVKKVNTFTAILVCQMQLKKQIKRRRALKAMEEEAAKKAEMLKKQAARLQEKKWRNAMKEDADEEEGDEMPGRPRVGSSDHV